MLGIGSGLMYQNYPSGCPTVLLRYVSDFSVNNDDWQQGENVNGTIAFDANQTDPGPGESGWLRLTYDTNQTANGQILLGGGRWTNQIGDLEVGDYLVASFDVYFVDDSGKFGSDAVTYSLQQYAIRVNTDVELDTLTSVGPLTITNAGNNANVLALDFAAADDRPQAGAVYYIKNIVATVYRPCP